MTNQLHPSFEYVEDDSRKKYIFIGLGVLVLLLIAGGLYFFVFSSKKQAPPPPAPQRPAQAQSAAQPQQQAPPVQVVAKDPAQQPEVDKQVEQLRHFVQNPTSDDAVITVNWLSKKYNQPPAVIVRDIKVLTQRLAALPDQELAAFFASQENPWLDDPSFNSLIKLVSYRDYVGFIDKCADRYAQEHLQQN